MVSYSIAEQDVDLFIIHVVKYEIVDYDTTDILGVGEHLPFR